MLISPAHIGSLAVRPAVAAPTTPTIRIEPHDPPSFSSLPSTWTPNVYVTGLSQAKWAVFQVSTSGQYSSNMTWQTVDVVGGQFTPSASMQFERDRLVVKSLDYLYEDTSGPTVLNAPPPASTDGLTMARAFVSDMTVGLNIERGQLIWNGQITSGRLQNYRDLGVTHCRFVGPWGSQHGTWPNFDNGEGDWLFEACERAMAVGHKITIDGLDIMYPYDMQDGRVMPHLRAYARRIRSRNWDVSRCAIGAAQEYGGGTNIEHRAKMHEAIAVLRSELPNHLLMAASANWGNPWTLIDGTFVPPPDDRVVYQWHIYADNADNVATTEDLQYWLSRWSAETNLVTWCGEYSTAPASGGEAEVGSGAYWRWPYIIEAGWRGMGQQRPTYWVVTDGSWWRLNKGSGTETAELMDDVAAKITAGDQHIRSQSWFQPITGGGGGGNPTPPQNQVTRLQVLHRGQSNAYYANSYGADWAMAETMAALTQLPVDLISRINAGDDNTIHSGTYSFWDNPYNDQARWLAPSDYGAAPGGWAADYPMSQTLNAVSRYVSTDPEIPLIDLRLHWEYDIGVFDGPAKAAYREGAWEITRRIRAARNKSAGKHVAAYAYCPYQGGDWGALWDVNLAWMDDMADASRNVVMACGNMLDGEPNTQYDPNGDYSHWGNQASPRIYPRIAFRLARLCYDKGWLPSGVDLSDCPSMGPYIQGASRSGNSLNLTIAHDKGSSLVAGIDGIDWTTFHVSNTDGSGGIEANGGAITGGNTVRVDFPSQPPASGRIWYAYYPAFRRKQLIRDNWHSARPAKYASVPNVGVVEFPLQRTMTGVLY